jgi:hypothetical protein
LKQVGRRTETLERDAHQPDRLLRRLPAGRMRREDGRVLALDRVNRDADRRHVGVGHRDERGNHAGWLGVLDNALLGELLDDADALLPKGVAEDAEHLGAARRLRAAHAALFDAHSRQPRRRHLVAGRPGHRTDETIDGRLVVGLGLLHGGAGARDHGIDGLLLLRRDGSDCHAFPFSKPALPQSSGLWRFLRAAHGCNSSGTVT